MTIETSASAPAGRCVLSVVIPVYNELDTWRELLARVLAVDLGDIIKQIILVDDGSKDGTRDQLREFQREVESHREPTPQRPYLVKVIFHEKNQGKGAALRTGFAAADGELVVIQDADLEYDPGDYPRLMEPILTNQADVVYGSRFLEKRSRSGYLKNYLANRFLTGLSNLTTGLGLTDMETCYKMFRRAVLGRVRIEQNRFGFEPEITAKIARLGVRVIERPIAYFARTHEEGKKISWKDGLKAIWCIFKYGLFCRRRGQA